ncbi:RimJ/RimL family protein N-acetyltransferase [Streptomyces sp. LBL]|uniref:GNAT family N-acetyltransferase n=1 Tax=Streptomyces sp. LBL TaxID=2940562 RepID=UPI00247455B2|nr:GNAT family N-acetyltransferase [Streptomyces sp. LBL]MDH6629637.1 RimJ/RimL family protein N-acetyltransferase [Streptomyces sp. LBL]
MPPTDANANAGTARVGIRADARPRTGENNTHPGARVGSLDTHDTLDLRLSGELLVLFQEAGVSAGTARLGSEGTTTPASFLPATDDPLDRVADWGPIATPVGAFQLVPVHPERDLPLVSRWMNDPAVAEFWALAGPQTVTDEHLRAQLADDGRSVPCLGVLEGIPMSYWEIYRADLDPLARYYHARPHDTGIHLLIGGVADRGRGVGSALLKAVVDLVFAKRCACARLVAEPDLRNIPSIAAFLGAGFLFSAEVDLPAKRAALMVRDRSLRHLL